MPDPAHEPAQFAVDVKLAARVAEHLQKVFGVHFHTWCRRGTWLPIGGDPGSSPPSAIQADDFYALLDTSWRQTRDPQLVETQQSGALLLLPVVLDGGAPLVAVAKLPALSDASRDLLLRLAESFLNEEGIRGELTRLQQENQQFVAQVTQDFEELTFLRSISQQLRVFSAASSLADLAANVLPMLNQSVHAATLVLVEENPVRAVTRGGYTVHRTGAAVPDDGDCIRLVQELAEAAAGRPVVRNITNGSVASAQCRDIQHLVVVTVANLQQRFGWLMAIDRPAEGPWGSDLANPMLREFGTGEATLLESAASVLAAHAGNVQLLQEREALLVNVVRALVTSIEAKDEYTRGHSERVALFGRRLAEQAGFDEGACERIYLSGLLHDIGKIGVSDATLKKPGKLTEEEFNEIKGHPDLGWGILHDLDQLAYVLPGVLYHHERYDGKGYPDGLKGNEIPIDGRILAVADAYDAMTSDRPYRRGMPQEKAEAILRDGAGTQWDPYLIDAFFQAMPDIISIRRNYRPRPYPKRGKSHVERSHLAPPAANSALLIDSCSTTPDPASSSPR